MPSTRKLVTALQGLVLGVSVFLCLATSDRRAYGTSTRLLTVESYDAASNTWTGHAAMPRYRYRFDAAFLGGKLYLASGENGTGSLIAELDVFDPVAGTWETKASIPTGRSHATVAVHGGFLHVVGGQTSTGPTGAVERYDPATDTWAARSPLPAPRAHPLAAQIGPTLYLFCGLQTGPTVQADAWAYDLAADTWQTVSAPLTPRYGATVIVAGGKVYAAGGSDAAGNALRAFEVYDPATDTWTTLADLPSGRERAWGAASSTQLVLAGGYGPSWPWNTTEAWAYDLVADQWSDIGTPTGGVLRYCAGAALSDGLYLFGGEHPTVSQSQAGVFRYGFSASAWEGLAAMPADRHSALAISDGAGHVYLLSGWMARPGRAR